MDRLGVPRLLAMALLPVLAACTRDAEDLREWRPSDHHHQIEESRTGREAPRVTGSAAAPLPGLEEVTIATWQRACMNCHGQLGRGDGPQGAMVHARDLSDPEWQAAVTDDRIAESVTKGRGLMPPFALPAETVTGLVHLVRLFDRNRLMRAPGSAAAPAPSASARAPKAVPSANAP